MKRSDLKVGQSYAVSRNREASYCQERVLDSLDLHMQTHRQRYGGKSEGIVRAPLTSQRPTTGDTYPYREVGLLMHDPKTPDKQILVQPAHVKDDLGDLASARCPAGTAGGSAGSSGRRDHPGAGPSRPEVLCLDLG